MITFNTSNKTIARLKESIIDVLYFLSLKDNISNDTFADWFKSINKECKNLEKILREEFGEDEDIEHILSELNETLKALHEDNVESNPERVS